jgi:hypothetical protein
MREVIQLTHNSRNPGNTLEYMNAFGALFQESVVIHRHGSGSPVIFANIKRAQLIKKHTYLVNFVFALGTAGLIAAIFIRQPALFTTFVLILCALVTTLAAIFYRRAVYEFLIVTSHDYLKVVVDKDLKEDAKKMVSKINTKIKKRDREKSITANPNLNQTIHGTITNQK